MTPLLELTGLSKWFSVGKKTLHAVKDVSLSLESGKTLGLVGESGCGKTTLARTIIRIYKPDGGKIIFNGSDITNLSATRLRPLRREIQMIFQDPFSSLNPRMTIEDIIAEPILIHEKMKKAERRDRVRELLEIVGLSSDYSLRYPHEFSGGQRQRIGIARAIALNPKLIIADEPVSSLDVSVAAQIVNLIKDLQDKFGIAYLFIAHDLHMIYHISHDVAVMYLGEVVETAPVDNFSNPLHPYTRALVSAVPIPDPEKRKRRDLPPGEIPSPLNPPSGCPFHPRCPYAENACRFQKPVLKEWERGRFASCRLVGKF